MLANLDQHAWKFWRNDGQFVRKFCVWSSAEMRRSWRSQRMLKIEYVVAIIGFDTAENEPSKPTCLPFLILQTLKHRDHTSGSIWRSVERINRMTSFHGCTYFFNSASPSKDDHKRKRQCWRDLSYANTRFTMESIHDASRSRQKTKKNALNSTVAQRRSVHGCCRKQLGQPSKGCVFPTHVSATCWCTRSSALT